MSGMEGENDPGVGTLRMRGLIQKIRQIIPEMIEPDSVNQAGRGALAVWGRDINFVIQLGSTSTFNLKDDTVSASFQAMSHGQHFGGPVDWDDRIGGGVSPIVLDAISHILPHVIKEREAYQATEALYERVDAHQLADAVSNAKLGSPKNEIAAALESASPEKRARILAMLAEEEE